MGRIQFDDKVERRVQIDDPRTRRRLTDDDLAQTLGAEFVGAAPRGGNLLSAYALRNELFERYPDQGSHA